MKLRIRHMAALACLTLCTLPLAAEEPQSAVEADSTIVQRINQSERIIVLQPDGLNQRLVVPAAPQHETQPANAGTAVSSQRPATRNGFRIQIYDSNARGARDEAQRRKRAVESRMRQPAYLRFDSPYWRVRVGNYRSRAEAESGLSELRRLFPGFSSSFRIVQDRITTTH